jgi:hypothetical protein
MMLASMAEREQTRTLSRAKIQLFSETKKQRGQKMLAFILPSRA